MNLKANTPSTDPAGISYVMGKPFLEWLDQSWLTLKIEFWCIFDTIFVELNFMVIQKKYQPIVSELTAKNPFANREITGSKVKETSNFDRYFRPYKQPSLWFDVK